MTEHHHHKSKISPAVWIPVLTALISALTTLGVTYIQATAQAGKLNETRHYRQLSQRTQHRVVNTNVPVATVNMSIKGFYVETNQ